MSLFSRSIVPALGAALSLAGAPAGATVITASIPGADFSTPSTIGTFAFSLPPGSVIDSVSLYSPSFMFASGNAFALTFDLDNVGWGTLPLSQTATEFFLGNTVPPPESLLDSIAPLLSDGSATLSVHCEPSRSFPGPCPDRFTFFVPTTGGLDEWKLVIDTKSVPEPGTLALLSLGLAAMSWVRRKRAH